MCRALATRRWRRLRRRSMADEADMMGVNSRAELAAAESQMQQRLRAAAMANGVGMQAPETVFLCHDTVLEADVQHRALRRLRSRRHGEIGRRNPRLLAISKAPSSKAARRSGLTRGCAPALTSKQTPISAISSRSRTPASKRAPRPTISAISAMRASARAPISARAPSPAITTASSNTRPISARAPSSVPTARWSRR